MDAIRARTVPGHPNKEGAVMPPVGGPPVLRGGHQGHDLGFQCVEVNRGKSRGVIKIIRKRAGDGLMLMKDVQTKLVWPPTLAGTSPNHAVGDGFEKWAACCGLGHRTVSVGEDDIAAAGMICRPRSIEQKPLPSIPPQRRRERRAGPKGRRRHFGLERSVLI